MVSQPYKGHLSITDDARIESMKVVSSLSRPSKLQMHPHLEQKSYKKPYCNCLCYSYELCSDRKTVTHGHSSIDLIDMPLCAHHSLLRSDSKIVHHNVIRKVLSNPYMTYFCGDRRRPPRFFFCIFFVPIFLMLSAAPLYYNTICTSSRGDYISI